MQRKRRNRGTWMPNLGHLESTGEDTAQYADLRLELGNVPAAGGQGAAVLPPIPLVPDFTEEQTASGSAQLRDQVSGQSWLLQRIVGKLHLKVLNIEAYVAGASWPNLIVTAGFLVARSIDGDQAQIDLLSEEHDPQDRRNTMNPWIWRRTWMLGNPAALAVPGRTFPLTSTPQYGSVADGPHIDSKVKRFISREHRLWFTMSARGYDPLDLEMTSLEPFQPRAVGILDYRIFGSLRNQKNSSSF